MGELYERIHELALTRSLFYPSNEVYGGVAGFYDYGPVGKLIKNKIEELWRRMFIRELGAYEVETPIITPAAVLKASGHVDSFADPIVECKRCKVKIRADVFVEKEVKGFKWDGTLQSLDETIRDNGLRCPSCKGEFAPAAMFNLMFKTGIGPSNEPAYGRPETAQGIFTSFLRVFRNHGAKLPIGIAQIGHSVRNEISPRKGLIRMREFTQMEFEYFFNPSQTKMKGFSEVANERMRFLIDGELVWKTAVQVVEEEHATNEIMAYFLALEWKFYKACGLDENRMHFRILPKEETPHYSKKNIDLEVETSYGVIEINGNADRGDFDLLQHKKFSGQEFEVFVEEEKKKVMPHVFEASFGVDRLIFCILEHTFREKSAQKEWEWFDIPPAIAPYACAVFPLMKKDGLAEKAQDVYKIIRSKFDVLYSESGSIGRRYAKADEIGIPYCLTIDYQTLEDETVTIRYRNDGKQERVEIKDIANKIKTNIASWRVTL
jgi:glycyl-tRNA synthetase